MKVSLNWLKEFVELPATVAELTQLLTLAGVEVEGIETRGVAIGKVVVAQILESAQHPNADRLSVCKVDDGSGMPRQIVCGAKNYKVGDKVPLAQPGAALPGDSSAGSGQVFKIKVGKLRGVESQGMLCSAKELGLAEDADGLLILPQDARVGASLGELFPSETILDLEITPNRADLLSHAGIAREVAALTGRVAATPPSQGVRAASAGGTLTNEFRQKIIRDEGVAAAKCPFYSARKISGVKVGLSPAWLKRKLEAVGVRSINNIVDVTNFVLLEMGQPLHAFDADKLRGGIRVRTANDGEEFLALDGRTYKLSADDLLIADEQRAIAIAGVMGGEETGVTQTTTNVLLESAYFQPSSVRRTARRLGLTSDSSYRFERGVDPEGVLAASQRATDLILEIAGGVAENETATTGILPNFSRDVLLRKGRCTEVLGTEIPGPFIAQTLTRFGLTTSGDHVWRVPSFRQDLMREIDLIEEVTRVFGIEKIPSHESARFAASTATDREHDRNMQLRRALAAQGFYEARTLSLVDENAVRGFEHAMRLRNPLASDQTVLRPSLIDGLMRALAHNARAGAKSLRLFELGRVFRADGREERTSLALVMMGALAEKSWRKNEEREADIFDLKGVLESLGLGELAFAPMQNPALALAAAIKLGGRFAGCAGKIWPAKAREIDLTNSVVIAEVELSEPRAAKKHFSGISKFPFITRDIALVAPADVRHAQVTAVLKKLNEPLLLRAELFDVFTDPTGAKVAADKKSMAYSLTYQAKDRTLTADEVNAAHARLKERLKADLNVTFREIDLSQKS